MIFFKYVYEQNKAAFFFTLLLLGSFYLQYTEFAIIVPNYIQIFVENSENQELRFYPRPKIQETTTSSPKTEKDSERIEKETKKAENSEYNESENQSQMPANVEKTDWSLDLKTWTIVVSYKSKEMKFLNEEFLAFMKFHTSKVNFEFLFVEKEDENDSLSIEKILPEIMTDVVVFKSEADIILLPNLVAKKPNFEKGIICIEDDLTIKQKSKKVESDFVKFTFRDEILGPCGDKSLRQGPFMLSKTRFLDNIVTSKVTAPVIVRSKPLEFISVERILSQSVICYFINETTADF